MELRWLFALLLAASLVAPAGLIPTRAGGAELATVTVTGFAEIRGASDTEAARRRAIADALLSAALAGETSVSGYSASSMGVISGDFTMIQSRYRVVNHKITDEKKSDGVWRITISAQVAPPELLDCRGRQVFPVTAYAPRISVAPDAPAWSAGLAQELAERMLDLVDNHGSFTLTRATNSSRTRSNAKGVADQFDYAALTTGKTRVAAGDWALEPSIRFDLEKKGGRSRLVLEYQFNLYTDAGSRPAISRKFTSSVALPRAGAFGVERLVAKDRRQIQKNLMTGAEAFLADAMTGLGCQPLSAKLVVAGDTISVDVGSRQGLGSAFLAYTTDRNGSLTVLEIAKLGTTRTTLKPLDANLPAQSFRGRQVEFLEIR